jgi:glycosyltransferase involved in cell wall biosynthesis
LLENPTLAKNMGRCGRQRVEKEFSLEKQVTSFEDLYQRYLTL